MPFRAEPVNTCRARHRSRAAVVLVAVAVVTTGLSHVVATAPPASAAPGVVFSDGFDSGDLSQWTGASGVVVSQQDAFAGTSAARATTTGAASYVYKSLTPPLADAYYGGHFKVVSQANN